MPRCLDGARYERREVKAALRICLITPGHLSTNPRLVKEADAFAEAGHDVSVIAADFVAWARETDKAFASRQWKVERTLSFGPLAPRLPRIRQVARQRLARAMVNLGYESDRLARDAFHPIASELVEAALLVRADLYVAHYPAALPAAAKAAKRHGGRFAYDAEDFHLGDWPDEPEHDHKRALVRMIESRHLPQCAYITAASPGIADALVAAYGIARPMVILNVFPLKQAPVGPTPAGTATPGPSIYWFSQTIGPDRGLECAVRAIGLARTKPHLYLRGTPSAGFVVALSALAAEAGAAGRLHVVKPGLPLEMERLAAAYDVGLVGEIGHTTNRRIALTNKQFTYLLAGIPCVMSDIAAHRDFAEGLSPAVALFSADDARSLAAAIDDILEQPERLAAARRAAFQLGRSRFNWDAEKVALIAAAEQAAAPRGPLAASA